MLRYNDTYKEHFEDSKDPEYENNLRVYHEIG